MIAKMWLYKAESFRVIFFKVILDEQLLFFFLISFRFMTINRTQRFSQVNAQGFSLDAVKNGKSVWKNIPLRILFELFRYPTTDMKLLVRKAPVKRDALGSDITCLFGSLGFQLLPFVKNHLNCLWHTKTASKEAGRRSLFEIFKIKIWY